VPTITDYTLRRIPHAKSTKLKMVQPEQQCSSGCAGWAQRQERYSLGYCGVDMIKPLFKHPKKYPDSDGYYRSYQPRANRANQGEFRVYYRKPVPVYVSSSRFQKLCLWLGIALLTAAGYMAYDFIKGL